MLSSRASRSTEKYDGGRGRGVGGGGGVPPIAGPHSRHDSSSPPSSLPLNMFTIYTRRSKHEVGRRTKQIGPRPESYPSVPFRPLRSGSRQREAGGSRFALSAAAGGRASRQDPERPVQASPKQNQSPPPELARADAGVRCRCRRWRCRCWRRCWCRLLAHLLQHLLDDGGQRDAVLGGARVR